MVRTSFVSAALTSSALSAGCTRIAATGSPGFDERPVQETVGVVMRDQERFDPAPQRVVGRAFAVEDVVAIGQGFLLDGRQEYGLDMFRVERHGVDLVLGATFHAPFAALAVEKKEKETKNAVVLERRCRREPRGRRPRAAPRASTSRSERVGREGRVEDQGVGFAEQKLLPWQGRKSHTSPKRQRVHSGEDHSFTRWRFGLV